MESPNKDPVISIRTTQYRFSSFKVLRFFFFFLSLGVGIIGISVYTIKHLRVQNFFSLRESVSPPFFGGDPNSLSSWMSPPSTAPWHSMEDGELLWRASLHPGLKKYPFDRVPKIAFMFLAKGPLPLAPIWERFFRGHERYYSIYIHSLPSYTPSFTFSSVFHRRQIPSKVAEWGRMSMCDAERRLLANALLDFSNEWFVLLSESCIPLHNFSIVYRYIARSRHSFTGSFDDPGPHGRGRYDANMAPEVSLSQWRKGSQWFQVDRKLALAIVSDTAFYPKFEEFCRPACYVDEHYFPTMLSITAPHELANRSITWVDWSRGGAHPATFGKSDITRDLFVRILERSTCTYNGQTSSHCFLFARKFAPSALAPLLELASEALAF